VIVWRWMYFNYLPDRIPRLSTAVDLRLLNLIRVSATAEWALCQDGSFLSIANVRRSNDFSLSLENTGTNAHWIPDVKDSLETISRRRQTQNQVRCETEWHNLFKSRR
jgi:hypothetical protein